MLCKAQKYKKPTVKTCSEKISLQLTFGKIWILFFKKTKTY